MTSLPRPISGVSADADRAATASRLSRLASSSCQHRIANAWPEIEYDGGYPVDEEFSAFANLPLSFVHAQDWLRHELPRATENMQCFCTVRRATRHGKPIWRINFSTMGWSGAESIIGLINSRPDLRIQMYSWRRGGHYVFEVPFVKSERPISEIRKQAWETRRAKYGERGHR